MAKQIATPKQTSGAGFVFEDKVVGYYLAWMLAGTAPFNTCNHIERLDCQVAVDGWDGFDDLLVTLTDGRTSQRQAFSLKSYHQITKNAAAATFVNSAWRLILHKDSPVMDTANDSLGLICVPLPDPPKTAIQSLLKKARQQTPNQLFNRLPALGYASKEERNIHDSCACPKDFGEELSEEERLAGRMLKKLSVIELDFENAESIAIANILFICSKLVLDGSDSSAQNLWNGLCQIAQRVRIAGGGISREELFHEIRSVVELRDLPDFTQDWENLVTWRDAELSALTDRVAGSISIDRNNVVAEVMDALKCSRYICVAGVSGTGKSVIAKRIAKEFGETGNVLWFKGERLRSGYIENIGSLHNLRHPLKNVLNNGSSSGGLIVVDNCERLIENSDYSELCLLLHMLQIEKSGCGWRLLVTCREEAWERIQFNLVKNFGGTMSWTPIRVDYPIFDELVPVWDVYPSLRMLAVRPHLSQIMRNLKVLDLLASAISSGCRPDARSWLGESDLIRWYWKQIVRQGSNGAQRDVFLRRLASKSADTGRFETPETDCAPEDLSLIENLRDLLSTDEERGMIVFSHDLIADWARFQTIVSHENDLAIYCEHRFANPRWHAALRLYGVSLLEADNTGVKWSLAITAYPDARDSFLESLVFAGNAQELLNSTWSVLVADEGSLLKAFLKRFQHVASIPNPRYMAIAAQLNISTNDAQTLERIPLWMYWVGTLTTLAKHEVDLLKFASVETARLVRSWLRHTPQDFPGRQPAAALALSVAQQEICNGSYSSHSKNDGQLPYQALLEAYPDEPIAARELLLKAAARIVPEKEDGDAFEYYEPPGTVTHVQSILCSGDRVWQEPWPDGPLYRVNSTFRTVCFETDALRKVMALSPELAKEIILSLLIEHPSSDMPFYSSRKSILAEDSMCLENDFGFHPRFYTKGPFLLFLRVNPDAAFKTVIQLIDFATERWMECRHDEEDWNNGIDLPVDGNNKRFIGDYEVYHWYHGVSKSQIVASALMAVEKWLYECLDKKELIDGWLKLILETSQSMAFLGVLSEIGRYEPSLFGGVLRPLILVMEPYYFETCYVEQDGLRFGTPPSLCEGESFFNMAREWDTMSHRHYRMINIAAYLFKNHTETREALISARKEWITMPDEGDSRWCRYRKMLIATFDDDNWKEVDGPDGSKMLEFITPEHLKSPPSQLEQSNKRLLLLTLPLTYREMLDKLTHIEKEDIAAFVKQCKDLVNFVEENKEMASDSPIENAVLGTIAVLFVLHRDWLRAYPAEEKWCIDSLDQIIAQAPAWPEFDYPDSAGNYSWEHFACELAPLIWSEEPDNIRSIERIARLSFAKHYNATGILLSRAFANREKIGSWFWQLVNLLLDWAAMRHDINNAQYTGKTVDVSGWIKKAIRHFIAGKYPITVACWGQRSIDEGKIWASHNHPEYHGEGKVALLCRMPRLDELQIQATFNSIMLPAQAVSDSERMEFLKFWDEALLTCLAGTRFFDENGNEIPPETTEAGLQNDYDRWVLKQLAVIVGQMRPVEKPERYWKPILGLGSRAKHWVASFLDHWFMHAKTDAETSVFVEEWKRMMDFCLTSDEWTTSSGWQVYTQQSLWMNLVGLPSFTTSLWNEKDSEIIEGKGDYFCKICPFFLNSAHRAVHFISWLSDVSATKIRLQMLKPVANAAMQASEYWWKESHLASVMTRYLDLLWEEHGTSLIQNSDYKETFWGLIHKTAGTQEPAAMELQRRMASQCIPLAPKVVTEYISDRPLEETEMEKE